MFNNRFADNDEYKNKIDTYTPLDENILKQIKAYFKSALLTLQIRLKD